jgi:hypothetical protein
MSNSESAVAPRVSLKFPSLAGNNPTVFTSPLSSPRYANGNNTGLNSPSSGLSSFRRSLLSSDNALVTIPYNPAIFSRPEKLSYSQIVSNFGLDKYEKESWKASLARRGNQLNKDDNAALVWLESHENIKKQAQNDYETNLNSIRANLFNTISSAQSDSLQAKRLEQMDDSLQLKQIESKLQRIEQSYDEGAKHSANFHTVQFNKQLHSVNSRIEQRRLKTARELQQERAENLLNKQKTQEKLTEQLQSRIWQDYKEQEALLAQQRRAENSRFTQLLQFKWTENAGKRPKDYEKRMKLLAEQSKQQELAEIIRQKKEKYEKKRKSAKLGQLQVNLRGISNVFAFPALLYKRQGRTERSIHVNLARDWPKKELHSVFRVALQLRFNAQNLACSNQLFSSVFTVNEGQIEGGNLLRNEETFQFDVINAALQKLIIVVEAVKRYEPVAGSKNMIQQKFGQNLINNSAIKLNNDNNNGSNSNSNSSVHSIPLNNRPLTHHQHIHPHPALHSLHPVYQRVRLLCHKEINCEMIRNAEDGLINFSLQLPAVQSASDNWQNRGEDILIDLQCQLSPIFADKNKLTQHSMYRRNTNRNDRFVAGAEGKKRTNGGGGGGKQHDSTNPMHWFDSSDSDIENTSDSDNSSDLGIFD